MGNDVPLMKHVITGSGDPLILVPGGLTGWLSWKPHAAILAESWQVIRLQLLNVALGLAWGTCVIDGSLFGTIDGILVGTKRCVVKRRRIAASCKEDCRNIGGIQEGLDNGNT